MKRTPTKKNRRPARAGGKVKSKAAPVAAGKKAPAGKAGDGTHSARIAEMKQHRDFLQSQNEKLGKAHAALEISHQRFAELHEQAPVGYLTFDAQGCIRALNTEAVRLLGVVRRTILGKPFVVYVEKADRKKFLEHLWKVRRSDSRVATDLQLASVNGTARQVRMTTDRHHDVEGRSSLFLSTIEDVTELRTASSMNIHLSTIVESSPDALMTITPEGHFLSWNPGAEKLFGYTRDEMIGRHFSILIPPGHEEEISRGLKLALGGGRVPPFETVRIRKGGKPVDVEMSLTPIIEEGRVIALTAMGRDITERLQTQRARRRKAELLSLAQEAARMGVFEWDLVTNQATWMPELEELMGMKLEDKPNNLEPWFAHVREGDAVRLEAALQLWLGTDVRDVTEQYRYLANGGERWFELRGRITRAPDGTALRMIGTNLDITERKKMEDALRESQRLARSTVEAIPAHIAVVDASGTIIDVNDAWREFAIANGATEEATGCGVNYLKICDRVHGMGARDAKRFAAGMRAVLNGRTPHFSMEYPCHAPTEQRWFAAYVNPFRGEGRSRAVVAHVNITAVKLAEEKFRTVMESAPDAMLITDRTGMIQMANRQAETLFVYPRKELMGKNVEMLMPPSFRQAHATRHDEYSVAPTTRAMGGGASFPARRKDGSEFPAEISLSPLQTVSGLLVCSVIRDITERKKAEDAIRTLNAELEERVVARTAALQKAVESLGQAIEERRRLEQEVLKISEFERQNIGQDLHDDLGQQLAGMWFFASTLEKNLRAIVPAEAANAGKIAAQLDKALALTRNLARGLQPVAPEPGGLMAALQELATRSSELFKTRCRVKCHRRVAVHDPTTATHLYRIAQEAVTNAAKHGRAKQISILLSTSAGELHLSVHDNGTGMKEPAGKHDGMGIRTMRYRAEAMGGSLEFRQRDGGGTSVICTIPIPPEPETENH